MRPEPRPDLADLRAYLPVRPPVGVVLDANENPYDPPDEVLDDIFTETRKLRFNRYPDLLALGLRAALSEYCEVPTDWIWVGTGSNEILLDACLAYGGAGRLALLSAPTYSMHYRQARIAGTTVVNVDRRPDFTVDPETVLEAIRQDRPDVVFVCSPNNPTGTLTPLEHITDIADAATGLVIVDEAYYEFCGQTLVGELGNHDNVIVVRTLSKAFRLAGVRIGYAIAQPELLEPLLKVRMPYAQSSFAQMAARVVVERRDEVLARVPKIVAERDRLYDELLGLRDVEVFASEANFVLFRHREAGKLVRGLEERGVLVRDFTTTRGLENCIRVTAGTRAENDAFLAAMTELV